MPSGPLGPNIEQDLLHPPCLRIELHDAVAIVGDKNAAVAADLEAVGPAVILDRERPFPVRRDLEDAPKWNIDGRLASAHSVRTLRRNSSGIAEKILVSINLGGV
jgi:hypothetical protein